MATEIDRQEQQLYTFVSDTKVGLVSRNGKVIIAPKFKSKDVVKRPGYVGFFCKAKGWIYYGLFDKEALPSSSIPEPVSKEDTISDAKGALITKDEPIPPKEERRDGRYGYVDTTGNTVIPFVYQYAYPFEGDRAMVQQKGLYGYINLEGKIIIPIQYKSIERISQDLYLANGNTVVDADGNTMFEAKGRSLSSVGRVQDSHVLAESKWVTCNSVESVCLQALFNERNEMLLPFEYSFGECWELPSMIKACHYPDKKQGLLDMSGNIVVPIEYDAIVTDFAISLGFILTKQGRKWKALSMDGTKINLENK